MGTDAVFQVGTGTSVHGTIYHIKNLDLCALLWHFVSIVSITYILILLWCTILANNFTLPVIVGWIL